MEFVQHSLMSHLIERLNDIDKNGRARFFVLHCIFNQICNPWRLLDREIICTETNLIRSDLLKCLKEAFQMTR